MFLGFCSVTTRQNVIISESMAKYTWHQVLVFCSLWLYLQVFARNDTNYIDNMLKLSFEPTAKSSSNEWGQKYTLLLIRVFGKSWFCNHYWKPSLPLIQYWVTYWTCMYSYRSYQYLNLISKLWMDGLVADKIIRACSVLKQLVEFGCLLHFQFKAAVPYELHFLLFC